MCAHACVCGTFSSSASSASSGHCQRGPRPCGKRRQPRPLCLVTTTNQTLKILSRIPQTRAACDKCSILRCPSKRTNKEWEKKDAREKEGKREREKERKRERGKGEKGKRGKGGKEMPSQKAAKLQQATTNTHFKIQKHRNQMAHLLLELFLPKCSLSTVPSAHLTRVSGLRSFNTSCKWLQTPQENKLCMRKMSMA